MKSIMSFVIVSIILGLATLSNAQSQQVAANNNSPVMSATSTSDVNTSRTAEIPKYSGVFYLRSKSGTLSALPLKTPEIKSKFKTSLLVGTGGTEATNPTFVVKLEGSGDPSATIRMALVEDGKIPLKKDSMSSFAKVVEYTFQDLGNRIFEVKPATTLPDGDYVIALREDNPFAVPSCFLFHVTTK